MSRGDEYRNYAAQCIRVARQSNNVDAKTLLLHMAQKWRDLADEIERDRAQLGEGYGA